jgi:hypothetical protein
MNISSGKQTGSALIYTGRCRLKKVVFVADVAKTPTITVEDNVTSAGTNIKSFGRACGGTEAEGGACNFIEKWTEEDNVICNNGIYATLSAAEGDYIIEYEIL